VTESVSPQPATRRDWPGLLALWAIVTACNLFKPFHIDDTAYVTIAQWISRHPLHPMQGTLNWQGTVQPISKIIHPHLYFYVLAAWGRVFGFSEPSLHLVQSLAALACILLFHRLARTLLPASALWATALVILGPAFLVEQNLMIDVPLLAAWLLFFSALICDARSERQTRRYLIAALACSAAILIKYSSAVLLVTLCLSLLLERRRKQAWTLLCPVLAVAAWSLFNYFDYGHIHILTPPDPAVHDLHRLVTFTTEWIVGIGALSPLGILVAVQTWPRAAKSQIPLYASLATVFALLIAAVALGIVSTHGSNRLFAAAFAINGSLIGITFIVIALALPWPTLWRTAITPQVAARLYLVLWVALTSIAYIKASPFIASRHILLILPALTLLLAMHWGTSLTPASKRFALALTVVISAGLCVSDWRFAAYYKTEAAELAHSLPKTAPIWAAGHWGWQWYATHNGFQEVDIHSSRPQPGDIFILPEDVDHEMPEAPLHLRLLRTDIQPRPLLNLFCTGLPARFYEFPLAGPWTLSRNCINRIDIYQVVTANRVKGTDLSVP